MNSTLAKEAMNPEEISKLFQDIKEAKAAGKEIVYVSLDNNMTMLFLETSKKWIGGVKNV